VSSLCLRPVMSRSPPPEARIAWDKVASEQPDLVLLDIKYARHGRMDGPAQVEGGPAPPRSSR